MTRKKITVRLADPRGFCAGVERAIEIVRKALEVNGPPVYVRHEIVHNAHVVNELSEMGAIFVDELDEVPDDGIVVFSAHGVPKAVPAEAQKRQMLYVDATCPLVSKVHREVEHHVNIGMTVLLIGHAGHPEVVGTMGQVPPGSVILIETEDDARSIEIASPDAVAYATQTTLSVNDTEGIVNILKSRFPAIRGPRGEDICYATTNRQAAVAAIAEQCDCFYVVGAQNSSNSKRLVEVAKQAGCSRAHLINNASEINWDELALCAGNGHATLGLSAGASAPEILVQGVIKALGEVYDVVTENQQIIPENVYFKAPPIPQRANAG